jgi:putative transposase
MSPDMPRSLRLEREGGIYHLINRGNYRQDLFVDEATHASFEQCLFEACEKCGWILEGFCVMTNHFHLVVRTPRGNLVYGMKWLQSTFANRYHRFRKLHGKLFQGRYKSLIVEESSHLGSLLHYVHLNPVRAGICSGDELARYRWSSYWYLHQPKRRPEFLRVSGALSAAGGLADTRYGRQKYRDYLRWLATDEPAQKEMAFAQMCRGWALGGTDFKRKLISEALEYDSGTAVQSTAFEGKDLQEVNQIRWKHELDKALDLLGKANDVIQAEKKSASWKVMVACALKQRCSAPNKWITQQLNMGIPQAVSLHVSRYRKAGLDKSPEHSRLIQQLTE